MSEDELWWNMMMDQLLERLEFDDYLGSSDFDDDRRIKVIRARDPVLADLAAKLNEAHRLINEHVRANYAAELKARRRRLQGRK